MYPEPILLTALQNSVRLPEGFHWIVEQDCKEDFKCFHSKMDEYTLFDYFRWSQENDSLVIVREIEGKVAGVVYLTVHESYIMIEMLARNKLLAYPGAGSNLIRLVEKSVAPQLGIREVRLHAMPHIVDHYDNVLGYEEYGNQYADKEWGELTPKRKLLP